MFFVPDLEKLCPGGLWKRVVKILARGFFQKQPKKMPENGPR